MPGSYSKTCACEILYVVQTTRGAKESGLPAMNSPVLLDYSDELAILVFEQTWMKTGCARWSGVATASHWPT